MSGVIALLALSAALDEKDCALVECDVGGLTIPKAKQTNELANNKKGCPGSPSFADELRTPTLRQLLDLALFVEYNNNHFDEGRPRVLRRGPRLPIFGCAGVCEVAGIRHERISKTSGGGHESSRRFTARDRVRLGGARQNFSCVGLQTRRRRVGV